MFRDIEAWEAWMESYREQERIRCPHCNFDASFDGNGFEMCEAGVKVSYSGYPDEEDQIIECPSCEKPFKIREHVRRTYDTCKIDEEFE